MAQYPKIESIGSIGSILLAILEVQVVVEAPRVGDYLKPESWKMAVHRPQSLQQKENQHKSSQAPLPSLWSLLYICRDLQNGQKNGPYTWGSAQIQ